jgi:hypothetical protein
MAVTLKLCFDDDVRRVTLPPPQCTFNGLSTAANSLFSSSTAGHFVLKYRDDEGDLVTIADNDDFNACLRSAGGSVPRVLVLVIAPAAAATVDDDDDAGVEAMFCDDDDDHKARAPWEIVAEFLSNEDGVRRLQAAASSPVVTTLVADFARTYKDAPMALFSRIATEGNDAFQQELHALRAVFESSFADAPELVAAINSLTDGGAAFCTTTTSIAHGSNSAAAVHFGVVCDGCDRDRARAAASTAAGHRDRTAHHIVGVRFKSTVTHDYDLCETCQADGGLDVHAPFLFLNDPALSFRGGRGGHGRCGPGGGGHGRCGPGGGGHGRWGGGGGRCGPRNGSGRCDPGGSGGGGGGRRGCRGSRRGDAFKKNLLDFAAEFVDHFAEGTEELLGRDTASAIKASLSAMRESGGGDHDDNDATVEQEKQPVDAKPDDDASWTRVGTPTDESLDPMERWREQLRVLNAIGYDDDLQLAVRVLQEEDGVMERVVARIASYRS